MHLPLTWRRNKKLQQFWARAEQHSTFCLCISLTASNLVKWQLLFSLVSSFSTLWFRVKGHHGEYIGYELGTSILVDQLKHLSLLHIVSFHLATPNLTCSQFFSTDFSCLCLLVQSENSVFWSPLLTYIHSVHGNHSRIYVWTMHSLLLPGDDSIWQLLLIYYYRNLAELLF